ncbi:MAG: sigma-70 family RNA polymerase sigma factor [Clostridia bacterium]|nr:sigma-70 family RNA polymerase sigma factor [Clostridia bacterium]
MKEKGTKIGDLPLAELLKAAKDNDNAMLELVKRFRNTIYSTAVTFRSHESTQSLEDLVQDGIVKLISTCRGYGDDKPASAFSSYFKRALINSYLDKSKGIKITVLPIDGDDDGNNAVADGIPDGNLTPEQRLIMQETRKTIEDTLKGILDGTDFNIFIDYSEGYSYKDIAAKYSVTTKHVDYVVSKAKQKFVSLYKS